jgi:putative flavoprotein involved in K+ transport
MKAGAETEIVKVWLSKLNASLESNDFASAAKLFGSQSFWRDLIAFTWNIKTLEGRDAIRHMLEQTVPPLAPVRFSIEGTAQNAEGMVTAWLTFETKLSRGKGHLRLRDGKGFTILTSMEELKGHEELQGPTREQGITHGAFKNRQNWLEQKARDEETLGSTRQPYCVIIGGGQGGIALGARLKRLGVPTIILEKNRRAGDSWRNRYKSLVLHDPVWYDHLPYIPFPKHWPVFTPKDKMGDWLEMYTKVMELNYWSSSECLSAAFDQATKEWTLRINRNGKEVMLKPRQLVFATGSYGPPREIQVPGAEKFKGEQYHSSAFKSGAPYRGKRCIVVGANSSAHDMCADLWENDAEVTMIQRSPTTVVRSETLMKMAFTGLYSEQALQNGITVEKADLIFASTPFRLLTHSQIPLAAKMAERDAYLLKRLNKAGFQTDLGEDNSGQMMKALRTGSGYYLDVGCSELIASGQVKVRSSVELEHIKENSVVLTNGGELPADLIIYATGYLPMNEWVAKIISREVADRVGPNWGYGSGTKGDPGPWEGELRNMWKPLKQEALWFHGGNLHLSRHYSQYVALQLKVRMENIPAPVY